MATRKSTETEAFVDMYMEMNAGRQPTYNEVAERFGIKYTAAYVRCKRFRAKMSQNDVFGNETIIDKYIRKYCKQVA